MALKDTILNALMDKLGADYVRLEEDEGISGFVVSPRFKRMSPLDRQGRIEDVLNKTLAPAERLQVLMIAGLTPEEYEIVGSRIRVHQVKEKTKDVVEILVDGGLSDAEYVRRSLNNEKGVKTTEPERVRGALGSLMSFQAQGTNTNPLTKARAIEALKKDRYIEVMRDA